MSPAHRNAGISPYVRCTNAMGRILDRIKKNKLPQWHTVEEMDAEAYTYRDVQPQVWNEHRTDIALLQSELGRVRYQNEVPK